MQRVQLTERTATAKIERGTHPLQKIWSELRCSLKLASLHPFSHRLSRRSRPVDRLSRAVLGLGWLDTLATRARRSPTLPLLRLGPSHGSPYPAGTGSVSLAASDDASFPSFA